MCLKMYVEICSAYIFFILNKYEEIFLLCYNND